MKRILIALAAVVCCVLLASCNKEEPVVIYSMGFESITIDPDKLVDECTKITNAFVSAVQTDLGVTVEGSLFSYGGGDAKVLAACEKAALSLQQIPLTGSFKFIVTRGSTIIYTWEK